MQVNGFKFSSTQAYYDFAIATNNLDSRVTKVEVDEAILTWALMHGVNISAKGIDVHWTTLVPLWQAWSGNSWQLAHRDDLWRNTFALTRAGKSYYKQLGKDVNKVNKI